MNTVHLFKILFRESDMPVSCADFMSVGAFPSSISHIPSCLNGFDFDSLVHIPLCAVGVFSASHHSLPFSSMFDHLIILAFTFTSFLCTLISLEAMPMSFGLGGRQLTVRYWV